MASGWRRRASVVALVVCAGGCGGTATFGLSAVDNQPQQLRAALDRSPASVELVPRNAGGKHVVYLVTATKGHTVLHAYDLDARTDMWHADAEVASRIVVGARFVAHRGAGRALVARDADTGKPLWTHEMAEGAFVGLAADRTRVFYVVKLGDAAWTLVALDGATGARLWDTPSPGQLGTPTARGGLVFSPFLKQWLVILDAGTGEQLARIRGVDEEISFVRATSDQVYFGSKAGVFLLDERAASGRRDRATYGAATLPAQFDRFGYDVDAFDAVQARYSAYDRKRIVWRAHASEGALGFDGDRVIVHDYRFFFGFDAKTGALAWAYSHPRGDVVASDHLGRVVGFVSQLGDVGALDPNTGARVYTAKVEVEGTVRGATFDADGWAPSDEGVAVDTAQALLAIARDRDARFLDVKLFALRALGAQAGTTITAQLLALIVDEQTPARVRDMAVDVLVERRDITGVTPLVEALAVRYDFITGARPRAVGVIARAIAALGDLRERAELDEPTRRGLVAGLATQLFEPQTPPAELGALAAALGATRLPGALAPLRQFVLMYRADPAYAARVGPVGAAMDALLMAGGARERALIAYVAADERTQPKVAEYASRALRGRDRARHAARDAR